MGEIAALTTSLCWSLNSIQFTLAGRRVGSRVVNRVRLAFAVVFLSLTHLLLHGTLWPVQAELYRWGWLGLSGAVGLILGDGSLFHAFLLIGPRKSMVLMTLVPVISTAAAWVLLGETLLPIEIMAILITVGGIAWVVSEREPELSLDETSAEERRDRILGVLLGIAGATGQALGLVAAKRGLVGDFPALSATVIRMIVAATIIWLSTLLRGQIGRTWQALGDRRARLWLLGGAFVGPFVGVWLSLIAVRTAPVGIASTLMALSPIMLIPFDHWLFDETITPRSIVGTVVALGGAAVIFLT
ncbi:MAG: DMT family transporter [Anaerolineae bacterium]|nr:DMT family transporter [Anaerolineae bacterium]